MCKEPTYDHEGNMIWCRNCDICKQNRINDWIGRCIAESRYATRTDSVTLTYGPDENGNEDHLHSALLIYSDVQNYFKRLRKDGYKFKYLVAGEYGGKKRRSHWHMIICWYGKSPKVEYFNETYRGHEYWTGHGPNGHTFWEPMTPSSVWYVCKYIQKQQKDDPNAILRMSKKPPIGHEYFQWWAKEHVRQGITPKSLHYSFDGVTKKNGERRQYYMHGVTAENFMKTYCIEYYKKYDEEPYGRSKLIDEFIDKQNEKYYDLENFIKEKFDGKPFTKQLKKDVLYETAKAHGGIKTYNPGFVGIEPFATCNDGTFIQYGLQQEDPFKLFQQIISVK